MSLFARKQESRSISYQDVWGRGLDVTDPTLTHHAVDLAMGIPIVQRCTMLMLDSVGMLPRDVYVKKPGDPVRTELPTLPSLIAKPSQYYDWQTWIRLGVYDLVTDHNAFGLMHGRSSSGWPTFIEWMPAREVSVTGVYPNPMYQWRGQVFAPKDVMHLRRIGVAGKLRDPNPFEQVSREVKLAIEVQKYGYGFFRNGGVPTALLYSDQVLDKDVAKDIKERFIEAISGRSTAVLGAGLKYEQVSTPPNESQHLETQEFLNSQFAQLFGIPPELVGGKPGGSLTYANLEQLQNRLRSEAIQPVVTLIENALTDQMPDPQYLKLNTDVIVRVDTKTRQEIHGMAITSGMGTVDERRALEDLPPLSKVNETMSSRQLAEAIQKIYLGVGVVISDDEAREILNRDGAGLTGPGPIAQTPALGGGQ